MSQSDHQPEDVASLFKKFGGDAQGYREFADPDAARPSAPVWALVPTPTPTPTTTSTPAAAAGGAAAPLPADAAPAVQAEMPAEVPAAAVPFRPTAPTSVSALWPAPARHEPTQIRQQQPQQLQQSVRPLQASASATPVAAGTRALDAMFARWAGTTPMPAASVGGHGLLSRWRSQG